MTPAAGSQPLRFRTADFAISAAETCYYRQGVLPVGGLRVEYGVVQFDHLVHWVPSLDAAVRYQALGLPCSQEDSIRSSVRTTPHGALCGPGAA